jgi:hypothetical protein
MNTDGSVLAIGDPKRDRVILLVEDHHHEGEEDEAGSYRTVQVLQALERR